MERQEIEQEWKEAIHRQIEAKRREEEAEKRRAEYVQMYSGIPPEHLCGMPVWAEIGPDGLPKTQGQDGWGYWYTYYRSPKGKRIHKKYGCCGATIPVHAWTVRHMPLCSKCRKEYPDMSWYERYLEIKRIKEEYQID